MLYMVLDTENLEKTKEILRERRIVMNMTQQEASRRSGVNISTLRHFEQSGEISYLNLLKLLSLYGMAQRVMEAMEDRSSWTLEQLERGETRKRARCRKV